ncbi:MAG: site-2 protease family protein, partial [Nodosilinea sp.]
MITGLILLAAIAILVWGYRRAQPYGSVGILAWLQSVVLMGPWLLFFGLFTLGVYINLAGVLLLVLGSTGLYVYLGSRLRALGQDMLSTQRPAVAVESAPEKGGALEKNDQPTPAPGKAEAEAEAEAIPIPAEDLNQIEGIFGLDTYFRTETIPYDQGAIFRGNLRGEPAATQAQLAARLAERTGDRYRLFLVENLEQKPTVVV